RGRHARRRTRRRGGRGVRRRRRDQRAPAALDRDGRARDHAFYGRGGGRHGARRAAGGAADVARAPPGARGRRVDLARRSASPPPGTRVRVGDRGKPRRGHQRGRRDRAAGRVAGGADRRRRRRRGRAPPRGGGGGRRAQPRGRALTWDESASPVLASRAEGEHDRGTTPEVEKMPDTLTVIDNRTGRRCELPIEDGAVRAAGLAPLGLVSYDPALSNTATCKSRISYIDGERGILRYRGYPIE